MSNALYFVSFVQSLWWNWLSSISFKNSLSTGICLTQKTASKLFSTIFFRKSLNIWYKKEYIYVFVNDFKLLRFDITCTCWWFKQIVVLVVFRKSKRDILRGGLLYEVLKKAFFGDLTCNLNQIFITFNVVSRKLLTIRLFISRYFCRSQENL